MTAETISENKPNADEPEKRPLFDLDQEFIKSGGQILEYCPDGRPKRWKCGRGKGKERIDPKGTKKDIIHYLNKSGEWEAGIPDKELIEEREEWRVL